MQIYPANIGATGLTADGNIIIPLLNTPGYRNVYTVQVYGTFGGGTVTAFTNPAGVASAKAATTNDIAILDASGTAISKTTKASFDFECNSDNLSPVAFKLVLAGSTNPALTVRVDNIA